MINEAKKKKTKTTPQNTKTQNNNKARVSGSWHRLGNQAVLVDRDKETELRVQGDHGGKNLHGRVLKRTEFQRENSGHVQRASSQVSGRVTLRINP